VNTKFRSLELFSGAGGLALGLHQAGFEHTALVEWNPHAAKTLKLNCQKLLGLDKEYVHNIDARTFDFNKIEGEIDLLAGGPPCQPFSTGGKSLAHLDPRDMFPVFLNGIRTIKPKSILIENVKGILRARFSEYFEYILKRIQFPFCVDGSETFQQELLKLRLAKPQDYKDDEQYVINYSLIDTADYGVPQRRERVLIVAYRKDLCLIPERPQQTHSKESLLSEQYITKKYWERHNIKLSKFLGVQSGKITESIELTPAKFTNQLSLLPWKTVRDCISDLPEAVHRGDSPLISNHIQHPGARIYTGHIGSYHDYPAKTLKAGTHGTPGGENMLRINNSDNVRYFTTREAARLQTFPDDWHFNGETWGSCITQLGNAVPVLIAKIWGENILNNLAMKDGKHV
jgi:DNA (cytosine-5)-methyltransferase 1